MSTANNNVPRQRNVGSKSQLFANQPRIPTSQAIIEALVVLVKCVFILLEGFVKLFLPRSEKSVKGAITVITGAGHGIGREIAYQYASKGATVVCLDVNKQGNDETVKEIAKLGYTKAHSYVCDVTKRDEVFEIARQIQREVGDVSILINNAGVLHGVTFLDTTPEAIDRTMNVNVYGHFWTIQAFLPRMLELNKGHIVGISSMCGAMGLRYLAAYCASKFAVRGMMETLRHELRAKSKCDIKLTTILPHMVDTGLVKKPAMRYPDVFPPLQPIQVAKHVIKAQQCEVLETSVPSSLYRVNKIMRLLPVGVGDAIFECLDIHVNPD